MPWQQWKSLMSIANTLQSKKMEVGSAQVVIVSLGETKVTSIFQIQSETSSRASCGTTGQSNFCLPQGRIFHSLGEWLVTDTQKYAPHLATQKQTPKNPIQQLLFYSHHMPMFCRISNLFISLRDQLLVHWLCAF